MKSELGVALFSQLKEQTRACLRAIDALDFESAEAAIGMAQGIVGSRQSLTLSDEDSLNDLAILGYFLGFLSDYVAFWRKVVTLQYDASWTALQDVLDSIRLLKRLGSFDLARFETQLVDLEATYPYTMFASIGGVAGRVECSICGKDIDSFECTHRAGTLYMGKLARGLVREFRELNHVALTENPADKRCVMKVQGKSYEYPAIDWLAANLSAKRFAVSDYSHVEMSQRRERNPQFVRMGRNETCGCGSGKKFKRCCISKEYRVHPHATLILRGNPKVISIEDARAIAGRGAPSD